MEQSSSEIVRDAHGHYRKGNSIFGECEVCDNKDVEITLHYGNMWFCADCWKKESALMETNKQSQLSVTHIETMNKQIEASRVINNSVQVRPDLFNAATVAIVDLKKLIDENPGITNKPYALAEELKNRFEHFKTVVFEMQEKIVEATNNQKAIQVYLNQLANSLRAEEREKLKIADINYQPTKVKPVTPKGISTTGTRKSTKLNKEELRKYAAELGIPEFTLQMIVVSKGITIETAYNMLKRSIESAKAETNTPKAEFKEPEIIEEME